MSEKKIDENKGKEQEELTGEGGQQGGNATIVFSFGVYIGNSKGLFSLYQQTFEKFLQNHIITDGFVEP